MEMLDYDDMKDLDDYVWMKEGASLSALGNRVHAGEGLGRHGA